MKSSTMLFALTGANMLLLTALLVPACEPARAEGTTTALRVQADKATDNLEETTMELGNFSVSLTVKNLAASRAFYEKLGFSAFAGEPSQNWLIMKNGDCVIGLFQGMFEKNLLTFNPGWDGNARTLPEFTDVRELQRRLKAAGVQPVQEADESTSGPASFVVVDPDGNPILFDQHI